MSVTMVNDWCFKEDADIEEGMAAIREYVAYLKENEPELEQSLWIATRDNPLRYFHVATFASQAALDRQRESTGTGHFVDRLYPLIDMDTLSQPHGPVVVSAGPGPGEV